MTGPDTLNVSELFGPTLQGEGPHAGRVAWFLRLMGCNLACSWCDTPWTWDASRFDLRAETRHLTADGIADTLTGKPGILVVTGGEPLLQQDRPAFRTLLDRMATRGRQVHVETNGTRLPTTYTAERVAAFMVSPKLPNAGQHRGHQNPTLNPGWAEHAATGKAHLKIVCASAEDVQHATQLAADTGFPLDQTWVMPEGRTPTELAPRWPLIADEAARQGLNATHRLHVLAWGDERGH